VSGTKESWGSPNEIISISQEDGSDGIIWVAMNYRLGVFGFLAGPSLQADGTANAGLHDQRLALQWVQENIAKFGGDPENVTVMGESAGAGSIMYHLISRGGQPVPFKRAIVQSIPLTTIIDPLQQENNFQEFLSILNVTSLEEARRLPSSVLIAANSQQIGSAPYNQFAFNPSVDKDLIPDSPTKLLLEGLFAKDVALLSSHTSYEGALFADPRTITNDTILSQELQRLYPTVSEENLNFLLKSLYPPIYNGSYPYISGIDRIILMTNEINFAAGQQTLLRATIGHGTAAYAYEFSIPPGIHGSDIPYTFYNGPAPNVDGPVASIIQHAIAGFAKSGLPDARPLGLATFPRYDSDATTVNLAINSSVISPDKTWNYRTRWWADVL
jgi:carboxylesterase type B